jgi:hypothetical protein
MSDADQRKWIEKNRSEVERATGAPVIAYAACFRSGSYGAMALTHATPLGGLIMNMVGKKKAGGLPQNFVIAVTADRVPAFKYKPRGWKLTLKDEVAVWDRASVRVSSEVKGMTTRVTLEAPDEDEKIVFDTGKGALADDLLAALGAGAGAPA